MKKHQTGASIWGMIPWLIALALATALVLLVAKQNTTPIKASDTPAQIDNDKKAWQPTLADPDTKINPDTAPSVHSYHEAVTRASLSVVNIYTTQKIKNPYAGNPVLEQLFEHHQRGQGEQGASNLGSGVIVSKDGYIITNAHVIEQADEITVALNDGRKARAVIVGADKESDLAVIQVEMENLTPLPFRHEPIRVGDVALAIGNPFGVGQTVTQGIISATGRSGLGMTAFEDFIQTDAAINPGNSGGALVDANGALVGINTMIYSRSGGSMGIGFAIPTSIVEQVMNGLISTGKVSRGWLGVEIASVSDNPTSLQTSEGVIIAGVMADGPADKAGLQVGDVVLSIDGKATNDPNTLIGIVSTKAPNSTLTATIKRGDDEKNITIHVGERPSRNMTRQENRHRSEQELSEAEREQLNELFEQLYEWHGR